VRILRDRFPNDDFYPFNVEVLKNTAVIDFSSPVVFFAGENGTGKSTLLKAMARNCGIYIWEGMERSFTNI
jgi:predicted ATPase